MTNRFILILEDNDDRTVQFESAVERLGMGHRVKVWRDAHSMRKEAEAFFAESALISLDHDLNPALGSSADPGTGLDVAKWLGDFLPVCPVVIHSSNTERVYSMQNELRFAGWTVDRVGPLGSDWIPGAWLERVRQLVNPPANTWETDLPPDHASRVERMRLSLDGLAIGDALGEMLAYRAATAARYLQNNHLPAGPWFHTDDTEMAISIVAVLRSHGRLHQDALAKRFYRRWERDPDRGYGRMTRMQMREMLTGADWRVTSAQAFGGQGSQGNGGAMRVAPLGAYFAEDSERAVSEAHASAVVTHTHPEGVAGAIAVSVAAGAAWRLRDLDPVRRATAFLEEVLGRTPESEVRRKILLATHVPPDTDPSQAAAALGRGDLVTAPDTVAFCVWSAAHHLDNYVDALAATIQVGGDCDTNAAIVGGIVALSAGREAIPPDWLAQREALEP